MPNNKKILLIIESCNPDWASVPLVGYNFFASIRELGDVTLVTHARNEKFLTPRHGHDDIAYIRPGRLEHYYYKLIERLTTFKGRVIWPLYHVLSYPMYYFFDRAVAQQFGKRVEQGEFDIVHALTPMMPRYPVEISKSCKHCAFILGPVNGGVPFPEGFKSRGRREFSQFNFFRSLGRWLIPNYVSTYRNASWVFAGSEYTQHWVAKALKVPSSRLSLLFENAVNDDFYESHLEQKLTSRKNEKILKLIFSGRLVPYKGADMLIRAIAALSFEEADIALHLTVVGDGPERTMLESLAKNLGVEQKIEFIGWIKQDQTRRYYAEADLFTFPSVREFGGAVVMEAMALGLPCLVVDNGGIGEYVDSSCGVKIAPHNEAYVIEQFSLAIKNYANHRDLLTQHSQAAFEKSKAFSWRAKAQQVDDVYRAVSNTAD